MLHIYDRNNNLLFGLDQVIDPEVTSKLSFSDKTIKFKARTQDISGLTNEGYIETEDDRFVIKEVNPSSDGLTEVVGQLDLEDLEGTRWLTFESLDATLRVTLMRAFDGTDWTVGVCDIDKERNIQMSDASSLDILKEALNVYRCEAKIDSKSHIVNIYEEIGEDRGVYMTPELNLTSLNVSSTTYDFYTELEVYGTKPATEDEDYTPTDQDLASLTIGSLTLTPEFSPGITHYTAKTLREEDTVTATAEKEAALIVVTKVYNYGQNELEYENGDSVDWDVNSETHTGVNTIRVDVTYGDATKTYEVEVTCKQSDIAVTSFKIGEKELDPQFDPDHYWRHWDQTQALDPHDYYSVITMNSRNRVKVSANSYYSIIEPWEDRDTSKNQLRLTLKYFSGDRELTYSMMQWNSEYGLLLENDKYIDSNDDTYSRANPTRWALGANTIGALVETADAYRIYKIVVTRIPAEPGEETDDVDVFTFEDINDGKNYVTNYEYSDKKKRLIWRADGYSDAETLLEDSIAKLADMAKPYVSYKANVRDLASASAEYSILAYDLGDTITLMDAITGTREKQRISEITKNLSDPSKNKCTLANKVLTFDELAEKWRTTSNTVSTLSTSSGQLRNSSAGGIKASSIKDLQKYLANMPDAKTRIAEIEADVEKALREAGLAVSEAGDAYTIAVGKTTAYYQAETPTGGSYNVNDIWFDTDDGNAMYRWDGEAWVKAEYGTGALGEGSITASLIASEAVVAGKIGAGAVTAGTIAADAVTSNNILAGSITSAKLDAGAVTAAAIAAGTITSNEIAAGTITAANIDTSTLMVSDMGDADSIVTSVSTKTQYSKSTSDSTAPTTGWQDTMPAWEDGKYIWCRTETTTTYASGTSSQTYSTPYVMEESGVGGNANSREQLIYIQAPVNTPATSLTLPTSWVSATSESVASDTAGLTPVWTTKRPTYRSNYPVLFVATQRETVNGTYSVSAPLIDDTTTVIDGGHIITGTIDANKIVSGSITTTQLDTNVLTVSNLSGKETLVTGVTTKTQYVLGTSDSTAPTTGWQDSIPTWSSGNYVWTKVVTTKTYADSSSSSTESTPICDKNLTKAISDASTASSAANGANAKTQLVYKSAAVGTTSMTKPSSWVSDTTGNQQTWTVKRPVYDSDYPVLFVATQSQTVGGTVSCTTPLIDATTTVIDGGNIITGTVTANQIASHTITTNELNTNVLQVSNLSDKGTLMTSASTKMQYYLSTSSTTKTGGSWSDSVPTWASGTYIWARMVTTKTYADGTSETTDPSGYYDSNLTTALSTASTASSAANGATSEVQNIYISKASGITSVAKYTTWVTQSGDVQNTWTLRSPSYSSSYPVLWAATQIKTVGGTVTCTTPVRDETKTTIDGGRITTGSIDANKVTVTNINASNINTGTLSADRIDVSSIAITSLSGGSSVVNQVEVQYAQNQSNTTAPTSGWSTTAPTWRSGYYIWQRTATTTAGSSTPTYSTATCISGREGIDGTDGRGVSSTTVTYAASNSGTTAPTSGWQSSVPSVSQGKYLWTKTVIAYTSGSDSTSYSVAYVGTDGAKGDTGADGKGISSTAIRYASSSDGTTAPSSGWQSSIPSVSQGYYLWTRTVITYTDNSTSTSYAVARAGSDGAKGEKGDTGATGKGISSTVINYASGTSGITAPSSGWSTSIPSVSQGNYLWTRTVITYTDSATSTLYSVSYVAEDGGSKNTIYHGTCSTSSTTRAKVVSDCEGFVLETGATIAIYNTTDNAYNSSYSSNLTLNVQSTGAKDIYINGSINSRSNRLLWTSGSTVTFTYDGTNWVLVDKPGMWYGSTCEISASTAGKTTTAKGGIVIFDGVVIFVPMTYTNTSTSATLNVSSVTPSTYIYYGETTTRPTVSNGYSWIAGESVGFRYDGANWRTGGAFSTIINGSYIQTGTIDASKVTVTNLDVSDVLTAGSVTADKLKLYGEMSVYTSSGGSTVGGKIGTTSVAVGSAGAQQGAYLGSANGTSGSLVLASDSVLYLASTGNIYTSNTVNIPKGFGVGTYDAATTSLTKITHTIPHISGNLSVIETLYTNSSPTSSLSANSYITMSQNLSNYDLILIEIRYSTSTDYRATMIAQYASGQVIHPAIMNYGSSLPFYCVMRKFTLGRYVSGSTTYINDKRILLDNGYIINNNGATAGSEYGIPTKVLGIRYTSTS